MNSSSTAVVEAARSPSAWKTFGLTSVAVFLVSLDGTIMFAAFPAIRAGFPGVSSASLSWILNAYTIAFAALLVPAGRLADLYGRKRLFLLGLTVFTAASLACGLAPDPWWLISLRVVQAIGAALLMPTSLALILNAFPQGKRAIAVSLWGAVGALAAAAGPALGALIIDGSNWQFAFLLNVPIGIVAWLRARAGIAESRSPELGATLDLPGVAMLMIGVGLVTLGIVQSQEWGWTAAGTITALVSGLATLAAFPFWAWRRPNAALDLSLFADRNYRYVNLATFVFGAVFAMMFLAFFLFLTAVWRYSLTKAGLAITPGPLLVIPVAIAAGRVAARIGHRPLLVAGGIAYALGGAWMYFSIGVEPAFMSVWLPGQLIGGLGVGLVLPSLSGAAVSGLEAGRFGIGSAVNVAVRQVGGVVGVAVTVAVAGRLDAGLDSFHTIYLCMVAGGLLTAALSIPVDTRRHAPSLQHANTGAVADT